MKTFIWWGFFATQSFDLFLTPEQLVHKENRANYNLMLKKASRDYLIIVALLRFSFGLTEVDKYIDLKSSPLLLSVGSSCL